MMCVCTYNYTVCNGYCSFTCYLTPVVYYQVICISTFPVLPCLTLCPLQTVAIQNVSLLSLKQLKYEPPLLSNVADFVILIRHDALTIATMLSLLRL